MRKHILTFLLTVVTMAVWAATPVPDVGNGRIRVVGNNLLNYYYNYAESSRPSYDDEAGLIEKTRKIADMVIASDADIFAFCEVEAKPITLEYLVDALNTRMGEGAYAAVSDGIYEETDSYDNAIKSGFIYRTEKVKPYGSNYAATNVAYYRNTMRIQAWEELATGERFTLSMNHFKAKSDAASQAKRVDNANWLINGLNTSSKVKDPDILIMGDLNAEMDEEAMQILINNNYEEQLLSFDSYAYSYCYQGSGELIDHAFANASMADQITGAAVWHINTSCGGGNNSATRYSDHDPYMVGLNLGGELPGQDCTPIRFSESFSEGLGQFTPVDQAGSAAWYWNSSYSCANMNGYNKGANEDYLISPAFDFTDHKSGTIAFQHAVGYGTSTDWPTQCQLLISDDYTGDVAAATWTQLQIPLWGTTKNFEWMSNNIAIPAQFMHRNNVHFAFYYTIGESNAPSWEIKDLTVNTVCEKSGESAVESVQAEPSAQKILRRGQLIIIRSGVEYTVTGQRL